MPKEKYMLNPPPKRDMLAYLIENIPPLYEYSKGKNNKVYLKKLKLNPTERAMRVAGQKNARAIIDLEKSGKYTKDKAKKIIESSGEINLHIKRVKELQPYKNAVFTNADKKYGVNFMENLHRTGKLKFRRR